MEVLQKRTKTALELDHTPNRREPPSNTSVTSSIHGTERSPAFSIVRWVVGEDIWPNSNLRKQNALYRGPQNTLGYTPSFTLRSHH